MANGIAENFDYTYTGDEALEFFIKPSVETPDVMQVFTPRVVRDKAQLFLAPNMSKITKAHGGCTRTYSDGVTLTNRTIETNLLQVLVEQCEDQFEDNFLITALNSGPDVSDISGTEIETLLNDLVTDGMRRDHFRLFSFGDTNDADDDWNSTNGMWTRLIAGLSDYCVNQASTQLNSTLTSTLAKNVLQSLYEDADNTLKQIPAEQKKMFVTGNVFEAYLQYLETQNVSEGWKAEVDGIVRAKYRGVEVVPIYAWDEALADTTCPLFGQYTKLAIYTTPANHIIGVDKDQSGLKTRRWFSKDDAKYRIESAYRLGYNFIHCDLQIISIG